MYCITILPYEKFFGTRNPYDNRYGANIVRSGPKNSGDSEAIVITENIVVSGIVIARLYCSLDTSSVASSRILHVSPKVTSKERSWFKCY